MPPPPPPESLPVGFRFRPTDEELVRHYLKPKIAGRTHPDLLLIPDVDLSACEPWELPAKALIRSEDAEWFFFAPLDRKYPGGHRSNRSTAAGYWKATGKDRLIRSRPAGTLIGIKKTLVFHRGRAPRGHRTSWIMHEYRTAEPQLQQGQKGSFVLYRLFDKHEEEEEPEASDTADSPSASSPADPRPMKLAVKPENLGQPASVETANLLATLSADEPAAAQEGDPLLDELAQLPLDELTQLADIQLEQTCDGFPTITSPLRPYTDHPFLGNVGGQDLSSYIDSIMVQQDLEDLFNNAVEPARTDMADSNALNGLEGWEAEPSIQQGTAARRIRLVHSIQRASVTEPVLITSNLEVEDEAGSCYRTGSSSTNNTEDYDNAGGGAMHSQGGGQIVSSMEVTEDLQDFMFDEEVHGHGGNLKRRLKQECSEDVVQHGKGKPSSRRGSSVVLLLCLAVGVVLVLVALVTTSRYLAGLIT